MVRPSLATVIVLVAIAALGFTAAAAVQRARTRATAPAAQRQAPAAPVAEAAELKPLDEVRRKAEPAAPATRDPRRATRYRILRVRSGRAVELRSRPGGGDLLASVDSTTEFGSPTTLAVAKRHGAWLGVTSTALPNGTLGWVKDSPKTFSERRTPLAIRIDLSQRRLRLVKGSRVIRTVTVAVGRPGSTTPTGRFAITDEIPGSRYGAYYGCCIMALSGKQPNLPPGWTGGDRLAIHGTDDPGSIGRASSAGCPRARDEDLRALIRRVALGTPVFIRA